MLDPVSFTGMPLFSQFEEEDEATHEPSEGNPPDQEAGNPEIEEDTGPSIPEDLPCEICGSPEDWKSMVLCSTCAKGWHTHCVALPQVPQGAWDCPQCKKAGKQPLMQYSDQEPAYSSGDEEEFQPSFATPAAITNSENQPPIEHQDTGQTELENGGPIDKYMNTNTLDYIRSGDLAPDAAAVLTPKEIKTELKTVSKRSIGYKWKPGGYEHNWVEPISFLTIT